MALEPLSQLAIDRTVEQAAESPFYIPMTGPATRPRRSLKHDDTFIVLDSHGDIGDRLGSTSFKVLIGTSKGEVGTRSQHCSHRKKNEKSQKFL